MRTSVKLCFTALTAALLLASAIATTSARNLSVSNQQFRVTWQELEFAIEIVTIICHVTLEGSFHYRTIVKRERTLIGYITQVAVRRPCRNGEAWAANGREAHPRLGVLANTLPWHVTYEGFAGTLPCITSIFLLLRGARFKIHSFFNTLGLYGRRQRQHNRKGNPRRHHQGHHDTRTCRRQKHRKARKLPRRDLPGNRH